MNAPLDRDPLLQATDVVKTYGGPDNPVSALRGVDLSVHQGDYLSVMGPSGSGKSTLLHILGLLHRPSSGRLVLFGKDHRSLDRRQMARLRNSQIGFVFQDSLLISSLSVLENAALPLVYAGVARRERQRRAQGLLEELGLEDRLDHRPSALSGGERQRTAIARALINDPNLILADEPTGNLDQDNGQRIMDILDGLHSRGKTVMVVTHDPEIARHGERTITIVDGRIASTSSRQRQAEDGE